jgi:hypothetical protein
MFEPPIKYVQIQRQFASLIFNSIYISNFNFLPKGKLFLISQYTFIQKLMNFWAKEVHLFVFYKSGLVWKLEKSNLKQGTGPAQCYSATGSFKPTVAPPGSLTGAPLFSKMAPPIVTTGAAQPARRRPLDRPTPDPTELPSTSAIKALNPGGEPSFLFLHFCRHRASLPPPLTAS